VIPGVGINPLTDDLQHRFGSGLKARGEGAAFLYFRVKLPKWPASRRAMVISVDGKDVTPGRRCAVRTIVANTVPGKRIPVVLIRNGELRR
jgi:serine protease Do